MRSSSHTHARAKALRRALSPPEVALWARLRTRLPDLPTFRRQHPIGLYIADFYCAAARLVIEIDGAWHGEESQRLHDERRDEYMARTGYRVVRISAADVMREPDEVAQGIVDMARMPSKR
ncbi:MAG TPA: endonuclease domain-containing protein [Caulobacteraceae bacterium]|nr:endonuclease domain-containing protein [Caulobacteraceae bacterium]